MDEITNFVKLYFDTILTHVRILKYRLNEMLYILNLDDDTL